MGLPMRGSLLFYKRSGTYAADYVRDPDFQEQFLGDPFQQFSDAINGLLNQ